MNFGEKDVRKLSTVILVAILLILSFFLIKPILLSIIAGLILAYILMPVYKRISLYVKNKTLAASILSAIIIILIIIVIWFMIPLILKQVSDIYIYSQTLDTDLFLKKILPDSADQLLFQASKNADNIIDSVTNTARNALLNIFLNIPNIILHLFIIAFIFFFTVRDSEKLKEFAKGISPLNEAKERIVVKHFKDMTDSIIYGQIIVGLIQGLLAGIGLWVFGVGNALILTILAIFFSIIPFLGPFIIWIPVSIYLFSTGNTSTALIFLLYNVFIVSIIDNILRPYLISKRTNVSPAVILVGMFGGVYVFGLLGLILGPLILAYLITLLESFKDKSIYSLFE